MQEIQASTELVAYCGLYCGACKSSLKARCQGCGGNQKASWCKIRSCCIEKSISSCAECTEYPSPNDCKKFNNFIARLFGLVFKSDRAACIDQIRTVGLEGHAMRMAEQGIHTIRRI